MFNVNGRRFLLLGMVLLLLLPLVAACKPTTTTTSPTGTVTTSPTPTRTPRPKIKVGVGYALASEPGKKASQAVLLGGEDINAAGGVSVGGVTYDLELITADTNELASPTDAATAVERLITVNGIRFFIGTQTTDGAAQALEVLADHKIPSFTTSSEVPKKVFDNYDKYKYLFNGQAPPQELMYGFVNEVLIAGNAVKTQLGIEKPKVALLFNRLITFDPLVGALQAQLPKFGFEVVGAWRPAVDATDVTAEFAAIQSAGAHIILQALVGPVAITIARQWGELKVPAALTGLNQYGEESFWNATGGYANYVLQFNLGGARIAITPKTIPFMDRFKAKYGTLPTVSMPAYDYVGILADAITRAGTLDADAVVAALEKTDYSGALGRFVGQGKEAGVSSAHRYKYGPGYLFYGHTQWRDGTAVAVWPDGKATPWEPGWAGIRYEGTQDYVLPPWMASYWKGK